jgi:hypothetical protein
MRGERLVTVGMEHGREIRAAVLKQLLDGESAQLAGGEQPSELR